MRHFCCENNMGRIENAYFIFYFLSARLVISTDFYRRSCQLLKEDLEDLRLRHENDITDRIRRNEWYKSRTLLRNNLCSKFLMARQQLLVIFRIIYTANIVFHLAGKYRGNSFRTVLPRFVINLENILFFSPFATFPSFLLP